MLQITLLGKTKICFNGELLNKQLSTKAQALIYLLVMCKGKFLSREKIVAYLWPDSAEDAARYNLRYNLWQLKKLLPEDHNGESLVLSNRDGCSINDKYNFQCDLIDINKYCVEISKLEELAYIRNLFRGEVMEGWYLKNCSEFNEMILYERMRCERIQVELLKTIAKLFEERDMPEKALETWKEMALVEVDNEDIAYNIMRLHVDMDNRVAAINHYKKFEATLWDNLNIAPKEEIQKLYRDLISVNKQEERNAVNLSHETKTAIEISCYCMKDIEYFLITDIISGLLRSVDKKFLKTFEKSYIRDLSVIHKDLNICYEKITGESINQTNELRYINVPPVRIVQAFCKFIEFLSLRYTITLHIKNIENIDKISSEIIEYLSQINIPDLHFS